MYSKFMCDGSDFDLLKHFSNEIYTEIQKSREFSKSSKAFVDRFIKYKERTVLMHKASWE